MLFTRWLSTYKKTLFINTHTTIFVKHSYHQFTFTAAVCCGIANIPYKESKESVCNTNLNCMEIAGFETTFHVMNFDKVGIDEELQLSQQITAITIKQTQLNCSPLFWFYIAKVVHRNYAAYAHNTGWSALFTYHYFIVHTGCLHIIMSYTHIINIEWDIYAQMHMYT